MAEGFEPARIHKPSKVFTVMADLETRAIALVLVLERVEAMRAEGNDILDVVFLERRRIFFCQLLEQKLVSDSACWIAATFLFTSEDGKLDAASLQQLSGGSRDLLVALVQGAAAADPEQN